MSLRIIPRSEWAAIHPNLTPFDRVPDGAVIHHTVDNGPNGGGDATQGVEEAYLRVVENYHVKSRGMKAIAYNYIIMPSGRVFAGRGYNQGGHTYNENDHLIGICFAGTFTARAPTDKAIESARNLIEHLRDEGRLRGPVTGHRDWGAAGGGTACPGDKLYPLRFRLSEGHLHDHKRPHKPGRHHHHSHRHPHLRAKDGHHHRHR